MGRGKIEIKRIENSTNRQVTYAKRRQGIIKKAKEITVLCDAKVSLIIFSSNDRMHEYCSPSTTLVDILNEYHKCSGKLKLWDAKHENLSNEIERVKKENENMLIELRHLNAEDITSLKIAELQRLEDALENGLAALRDRKMEYYKRMKKNINVMEDEMRQLSFMLHQQQMTMEGNVREMDNPYHQQRERDYNSQMPFAFRVQPIQPNLQDRM